MDIEEAMNAPTSFAEGFTAWCNDPQRAVEEAAQKVAQCKLLEMLKCALSSEWEAGRLYIHEDDCWWFGSGYSICVFPSIGSDISVSIIFDDPNQKLECDQQIAVYCVIGYCKMNDILCDVFNTPTEKLDD